MERYVLLSKDRYQSLQKELENCKSSHFNQQEVKTNINSGVDLSDNSENSILENAVIGGAAENNTKPVPPGLPFKIKKRRIQLSTTKTIKDWQKL